MVLRSFSARWNACVHGNHGLKDLVVVEMLLQLVNRDLSHGSPPVDLIDQRRRNLRSGFPFLRMSLMIDRLSKPSIENAEPAQIGTMTESAACIALTTKNPMLGAIDEGKVVMQPGVCPDFITDNLKAIGQGFEQGRFKRTCIVRIR
jgi:hypothetical protein